MAAQEESRTMTAPAPVTDPQVLRATVKVCMFDQYGTVVDMQSGLVETATPFLQRQGWAGDPNSFVTWWRRTHFENSMIDALLGREHTSYREIGERAVSFLNLPRLKSWGSEGASCQVLRGPHPICIGVRIRGLAWAAIPLRRATRSEAQADLGQGKAVPSRGLIDPRHRASQQRLHSRPGLFDPAFVEGVRVAARCEKGTSVTGLHVSIPFERHPVAGVLLLSGVSAGLPPDGV
jgi:hypothetical protein